MMLFQEQITSIDEHSPGCVSEMNKEQFVLFMCIVSVIDCAPFIHGDFEQLKDIFNTKDITYVWPVYFLVIVLSDNEIDTFSQKRTN